MGKVFRTNRNSDFRHHRRSRALHLGCERVDRTGWIHSTDSVELLDMARGIHRDAEGWSGRLI